MTHDDLGVRRASLAICGLLMMTCARGAGEWEMPWVEDSHAVYDSDYFSDVTNIRLPVYSVLGFDIKARAADFDGDGDADLLLGIVYTANKFLLSNGPNKRFSDETLARLPQQNRSSEDIAIGDIDADGDLDAVVANASGGPELYLNDGHGVFSDEGARLPSSSGLRARLFDADGDQDLDLVIGNYEGSPLYLVNDGAGRFSDLTRERLPRLELRASVVLVLDAENDGDSDLIIAGPREAHLLLNDATGKFTRVNEQQWPAFGNSDPWEADTCDVNGDGLTDVVFANQGLWTEGVSLQNRLFMGRAGGHFVDETSARLPRSDEHSLAIRCVDLDGDRDRDLITGTFRMDVWGRRHDAPYEVFLNDGKGVFRTAPYVLPASARGNGRDIMPADYNKDGVLDLYLTSRGGPDLLLYGKPARTRTAQ